MQPQMLTPGEPVTVKAASRKIRNKVITYTGVVVPDRYPESVLAISCGGQWLRIPWPQVISIR